MTQTGPLIVHYMLDMLINLGRVHDSVGTESSSGLIYKCEEPIAFLLGLVGWESVYLVL